MRIETVFAPPQSSAATTQDRWVRTQSTASSISSPHAPKWGDKILAFFDWIIAKFLSLFTWCLPKKAEPKPSGPPPEFTLALQQAKEAEIANQNPIPGLIKGLIFQRAFFYMLGRPVSEFYASVSIQATRYAIDKIANFTFPKASEVKKKIGSMALSNIVIYTGCKHFNYPFAWFIILPQALTVYMLYTKAEAEKAQNRQALLRQAVAN